MHLHVFQSDPTDAIAIQEADCSDQTACIASLASRIGYCIWSVTKLAWDMKHLETVIKSGKSYCDISFMAEDPRN